MQIFTLMHSIIDSEQRKTKNEEAGGMQGQRKSSNFSKKSVDQNLLHMSFQAFQKINSDSWIIPEANKIVCKAWDAQNHPVMFIRFAYFLEIKYINSGIFSMIDWHIYNH